MSVNKKKRPRTIKNFRDLGGIAGEGGRLIRPGLLYRSGHHAKLSERDAQKLKERLGIIAVADLRSDSELNEHPDVHINGVEYHFFSSLTDEEHPAVTRKNRRGLLDRIMELDGGARRFLKDSYRKMVSTPRALEAYSKLLGLILRNEDGAVLWHCTQGKDRAGVGTAAVLMALGASREDIMKDYLRTNRYYRVKNKLIYAAVCVVALSFRTASSLNHLLTARPEYLQTAFDVIDAEFGGTDGFLRDGLGLTSADLIRLRSNYLA